MNRSRKKGLVQVKTNISLKEKKKKMKTVDFSSALLYLNLYFDRSDKCIKYFRFIDLEIKF